MQTINKKFFTKDSDFYNEDHTAALSQVSFDLQDHYHEYNSYNQPQYFETKMYGGSIKELIDLYQKLGLQFELFDNDNRQIHYNEEQTDYECVNKIKVYFDNYQSFIKKLEPFCPVNVDETYVTEVRKPIDYIPNFFQNNFACLSSKDESNYIHITGESDANSIKVHIWGNQIDITCDIIDGVDSFLSIFGECSSRNKYNVEMTTLGFRVCKFSKIHISKKKIENIEMFDKIFAKINEHFQGFKFDVDIVKLVGWEEWL